MDMSKRTFTTVRWNPKTSGNTQTGLSAIRPLVLLIFCLGLAVLANGQQGSLNSAPGGITFSGSFPNFFTGFGTVNGLGIGTPMAGLTVIPANGGVLYSTPYVVSVSGTNGGHQAVARVFLSSNFANPSVLGVRSCPAALDCTNAANYTPIPTTQASEIDVIPTPGVQNGNITEHLALFVANTGSFSGTDSATIQWDFFAFNPNSGKLNLKHQEFLTLNSPPETVQTVATNIYVANNEGNTVSVVSQKSGSLIATIAGLNGPVGAAGTPDGSKVYVTNGNPVPGTVSVISTASNQITKTITVGSGPTGAVVSPDGKKLYVTNQNDGTVSIISTATDTVTATVLIGGSPLGVAITPDSAFAYVASYPGSVIVINASTSSVTANITDPALNGAGLIAITPDGRTVYVSNLIGNDVAVISTTTRSVTGSIPVGQIPLGLGVTIDGKLLYVANGADSTVSVINTATNSVVATISGFDGPEGVEVTPDGNSILVANTVSNTVSTIAISSNTITTSAGAGKTPVFMEITLSLK
jgi:YVTN family beta-propeller protein